MDSDTQEDLTPTASTGGYGTFAGVYVPTLLTILGVIMFLRQGWVLGNAGLIGGILIIALAFAITTATGLAMSSITTNIRIGSGGAYSIISQSLGLEVGGSIGIPLYLAQALAVPMYVFGFREGWAWVFPSHPPILVDLGIFAIIAAIAYKSAGLAFRVQYVVLAIIAASLISIVLGLVTNDTTYPLDQVALWGNFAGSPEDGFSGTSFWIVFAIFFPAATGIMAGANMSGDLADPRRSIPIGTMAAIGTSFIVYVLLSFWLVYSASTEELVSNYTVMIDKAIWGPAVLAGLLGATFSSGLASFVGAPRILQALGQHNVLPGGAWLAKKKAGEPRNALLVTAVIVFLGLMLRDLNAIAPLITMFFLITYSMINVVVFFEQSLGLASFRPLFSIPKFVSFAGMVGCLFAMFIINPAFSLVAVVLVLGAYMLMTRRTLTAPFGDVRSGMFISVAEWAAKRVWDLPSLQERAWKPNLLVAVKNTAELRGAFLFLADLAFPKGSVKLVGIVSGDTEAMKQELESLSNDFRARGVFANWICIESTDFNQGMKAGIQMARGAFPRPNIAFFQMPEELEEDINYKELTDLATVEELGSVLYAHHRRAGLGRRDVVNLWMRKPATWTLSMRMENANLSTLLAYKIHRNWEAKLRIVMIVEEGEMEEAQKFLKEFVTLARISMAELMVQTGEFQELVDKAPQADLNIFGMVHDPDPHFAREMVKRTGSSCIFVRDSGRESALA